LDLDPRTLAVGEPLYLFRLALRGPPEEASGSVAHEAMLRIDKTSDQEGERTFGLEDLGNPQVTALKLRPQILDGSIRLDSGDRAPGRIEQRVQPITGEHDVAYPAPVSADRQARRRPRHMHGPPTGPPGVQPAASASTAHMATPEGFKERTPPWAGRLSSDTADSSQASSSFASPRRRPSRTDSSQAIRPCRQRHPSLR